MAARDVRYDVAALTIQAGRQKIFNEVGNGGKASDKAAAAK
jgi:hypothetical protein